MIGKKPKQDRSKFTFGSILEATMQLLNRTGEERITTRGIAERAGVSIGSLYQYFRNTDSIFSTVLHDRLQKDIRELWEVFIENHELTPEARLQRVFERALTTHLPIGRARSALFHMAPSLKVVEFATLEIEELTRRMYDEFKKMGQLRPGLDDGIALYILSRAVFSVLMGATLDHEKMQGREPELAGELARLVANYATPLRSTVSE